MLLQNGDRLGPYEIISRLGAGGMGEVFKARDTRLDRTVAIKVAQEQFSDRFAREARAVAALNHPNICQLHNVGPNYLVMEFIEGAPLAPVDDTRKLLDLAVQLAGKLYAIRPGKMRPFGELRSLRRESARIRSCNAGRTAICGGFDISELTRKTRLSCENFATAREAKPALRKRDYTSGIVIATR
jgi:hypothetical protein